VSAHFLDNRLTDGGEVVSLTRRPPFASRKIPGTHFCQRLSRSQGHCEAGRIKPIEKSNYLIGNRTCDLPACNIVPQPTMLPFFRTSCLIIDALQGLVKIILNIRMIVDNELKEMIFKVVVVYFKEYKRDSRAE
jgi:hypothetical protein